MEWFNGGVAEAIAAAKSKSAVFVVVVVGMSILNTEPSDQIKIDFIQELKRTRPLRA